MVNATTGLDQLELLAMSLDEATASGMWEVAAIVEVLAEREV
jgi:hypothetical protein